MQKRLLLLTTLVLQVLFVSAQSITQLSGRVGDRITISAPSSSDYTVPDLYSVQWNIFSGDRSCISLVNATSRTVAVNLLKEGNVRIQCKCEFYNSSKPGYGKKIQNSYYDITISATGGGGGGGTGGGGGFGDSDLTIPNPTVGAGWTLYNNAFYYCAEKTEEGIPMRFTRYEYPYCTTFAWQSGVATCINRNTEGKVTIPAEVNGYIVRSINGHSFDNCRKITEVVLPNTIATINSRAFEGCSSLETITIPEEMIEIDSYAFKGCTSLKTVTCLGKNQPKASIYSDPFDGLQVNMTLYVPKGCKEEYSKNEVWRKFKEIIEIEDSYDITTSAAGYATFYSSLSTYTLPEGLTASVITGVDYGKLKLTYVELEGNVVPKGTAVMLTSADKKSGTYTLSRTPVSASYNGPNLLLGSDEATMVSSGGNDYYYKLSYGKSGGAKSNVFGWYWGASNGGAFQIEANKAWLALPKTSAKVMGFSLNEHATGVSVIKQTDDSNEAYFDLQGRRVMYPRAKGVYIKNGKQVIIK